MNRQRRASKCNKILDGVKDRYRPFVSIENRIKSNDGRHVTLIKPDDFESFLTTLCKDEEIHSEIKVLISIILSTGLRISEALSLQRCSFEKGSTGSLYLYSRVAKKKDFVERKSIIHPLVSDLIKEWTHKFRSFDKIFSIDRHQALYAIKVGLGESFDCHSFRHSHISYLLFKKKLTIEQVAELVKLSPEAVRFYTHVDPTNLLDELYGVDRKIA